MVTDLSLSQFFFIRRVLIYGFDVMLNLEMPYEATNMYQVENEAIWWGKLIPISLNHKDLFYNYPVYCFHQTKNNI